MDLLKSYLKGIREIEDGILEEYVSHWTEHHIGKKQTMTVPGQTEKYIYFVVDGIQKSYYLNREKEHVMFFAYAPSFSGVMESFLTQTPSKYYLETITDSTFIRLSYDRHQELISEHRELETLFRKMTEYLLLGVLERYHQLLAFSVEDRYRRFVKRSAHLLNMVPQKDIASYLRIDPTNFSKLVNSIHI